MDKINVLLLVSYLATLVEALIVEHYGYQLNDYSYKTIPVIGKRLCLRKCDEYQTCKSVNFNRKLLSCEMLTRREDDNARLSPVGGENVYIYREVSLLY